MCGAFLPVPGVTFSACHGHRQAFGAQDLMYILHR